MSRGSRQRLAEEVNRGNRGDKEVAREVGQDEVGEWNGRGVGPLGPREELRDVLEDQGPDCASTSPDKSFEPQGSQTGVHLLPRSGEGREPKEGPVKSPRSIRLSQTF